MTPQTPVTKNPISYNDAGFQSSSILNALRVDLKVNLDLNTYMKLSYFKEENTTVSASIKHACWDKK